METDTDRKKGRWTEKERNVEKGSSGRALHTSMNSSTSIPDRMRNTVS